MIMKIISGKEYAATAVASAYFSELAIACDKDFRSRLMFDNPLKNFTI